MKFNRLFSFLLVLTFCLSCVISIASPASAEDDSNTEITPTTPTREIVLILDGSEEMKGWIDAPKQLAKDVCKQIVEQNDHITTSISVISIRDGKYDPFIEHGSSEETDVLDRINEFIDGFYDINSSNRGVTQLGYALTRAAKLLSDSTADIKRVVILSGGMAPLAYNGLRNYFNIEPDVLVTARGISSSADGRENFFEELADDYQYVDDPECEDYAKKYKIDLSVDVTKWNLYISSEELSFRISTGDETNGIQSLTYKDGEFQEETEIIEGLTHSSGANGITICGFSSLKEYRLSPANDRGELQKLADMYDAADETETEGSDADETTEEDPADKTGEDVSTEPSGNTEPSTEPGLILFYNGATVSDSTCVYFMTELPEEEMSFCFIRAVEKLEKLEGEELKSKLVKVTFDSLPDSGVTVSDPQMNPIKGTELRVFPGQKVHIAVDPSALEEHELLVGEEAVTESRILTVENDITITCKAKATEAPADSTQDPSPDEAQADEGEKNQGGDVQKGDTTLFVVIGIAAVAMLVGLVVAIAVASGKKTKVSADSIPQKNVGTPETVHVRPQIQQQRAVSAPLYAPTAASKVGVPRTATPIHQPKLIVTGGILKGKTFEMKPDRPTTVGRGGNCDIVFSREERFISQIHMTVTYDSNKNEFIVVDSSSNGTFTADKHRLPNNAPVNLPVGSTLLLGDPYCSIVLK